jgi:hypothetical protein
MKFRLAAIAMVLMLPMNAVAQSFKPCETIITAGIKNSRVNTSSKAYLKKVFDTYCESGGTNKKVTAGAGVDLVIEAIPVGFTGNYGNQEEAFRNFCKTYSSEARAYQSDFGYEEIIVEKAYESFNQCMRFVSHGVSAEHDIVNLETATLFFWAGVGKPVRINGMTTSGNVSCTGIIQGKPVTYSPSTVTATTETIGIVCRRSPIISTSGVKVYEEGTVVVTTNVGNYSVFFRRDEKLPEDQASALNKKIELLEASLPKLAKTLSVEIASVRGEIPRKIVVTGTPGDHLGWGNRNTHQHLCSGTNRVMNGGAVGTIHGDFSVACATLTLSR